MKEEGIVDGDYVYSHAVNGVYFKGGLIVDVHEDGNAFENDEWKNENLRESVAQGSMVRCRQISSTNFFTKGKLNELGLFIKDNERINVVYVNSALSAVQIKKLEKRWNDILMDREDRMRQYFLKSAQKENDFSPTESDSTSAFSDYACYDNKSVRKIRVIDRFGMIL